MVASYSPEFYEWMQKYQKFWQQRQLTKGRPPSKEEMQATIQAALREAGISAEETRRSKVAEGYEAERLQLSRDALAQQKKLAEPNPWQTGIGVVGSVGSLALGYSALKGQGVLGTAKGAGTAIGAAGTTTGTAAGAGELGALGAEGFVPTAGATAGTAAPSSGWGGVAGPVAIVGAATMIRQGAGDTETPWKERSSWEKATAAPGRAGETTISEWLHDQTGFSNNLNTWLAEFEDKAIGQSLDRAFEGDFGGAWDAFTEGIRGGIDAIFS